jgi:hypothetical protein
VTDQHDRLFLDPEGLGDRADIVVRLESRDRGHAL